MCVVLKEGSATKWVNWIIVRRVLADVQSRRRSRTIADAPPRGGGSECPPFGRMGGCPMPPFVDEVACIDNFVVVPKES